jgi:hypothetical protein
MKTVKAHAPKHAKPRAHSTPEKEDARDEDEDEDTGDPNRSLSFDHKSRVGYLAEDGPGVDYDDPNLSALFAETGVEERLDELGL